MTGVARADRPSRVPVGTVVDIIRHWSADPTTRDVPAITFEGRTWTYDDLDRASNRLAAALRSSGVDAGDRVAYLDQNRPEYFVILFGAAKLGAVCVAVNFRLAPREIGHIVSDAGAKVLFVGGEFAGAVLAVASGLGDPTIVALDDGTSWESFGAWTDRRDAGDPGRVAAGDDVALQLYTSGTTGLPKGAMLANRNLFGMADVAGPAWSFRTGMVSLGVSPLFHIAGSGWNLMVLAYGGHVILHRAVDAAAILRDIERFRVSHAILVPAILQMVLDRRAHGDDVDTSSLQVVVYGASPISDDVLLALFDAFECDFVQGYGLTETCGAVTILPAEDHDRDRPELLRSCGSAMPGVELRIVDPDSGDDCADGVVGEVLIRGVIGDGRVLEPARCDLGSDRRRRLVSFRRRWLPARTTSLSPRQDQGHDRVGGGERVSR